MMAPRQAGGRAGEILPPAQKTKNKRSRTHFTYLSDALAIVHGEGGETHFAILLAIGMIVVIAFRITTFGAFSVSSAVELDKLKDSKIVRKDFNIAEIFLFCISDFICAYRLFMKVT
jgi:hypothetical protein